ncbi:putative NRPS-like protein biosynthetic cluster [Paecilomyces lecythidis]
MSSVATAPPSVSDSSFAAEKTPVVTHTQVNVTEQDPRTIDELVRHRASLGSGQPVIAYPRSGIDYVEYSMRDLDVFAYRVATKVASRIPVRSSSSEKQTVVGMLGPSDLSYLVNLLALSKLGHSALLLSTRISTEAYMSLLETTNSRNLMVHESFRDVAEELKRRNPDLQVDEIPSQDVYDFPIEDVNIDTNLTAHLDPAKETENTVWIIHSSGSTGLPKPIPQIQRAAIKNYAGNMNMDGFITLPLYHNHGISCLFRAVHSCKRLHLYNANLPLTKQYLLDTMKAHEFEIFYGVPYALKLLAETEEGIGALTMFKIVMFGGSPCPDSLGDKLVERGVNLISHYGSTETGQLMTSFRPREDKAWNYLRPSEAVKPFLRFEERSPSIYELVCLDGWPSKVASNRPDGAYATKDLFLKHPTIEGYKYYARLDDTIVLVNGEKVNPLEMEGVIRQLPTVSEAVVFGAGNSSIGLMLVPSPAASSLSDDAIIDSIWPAVEKAQISMPAYAQLTKDMVKVLPADTQYPRTDKGTVIRQAFYRQFGQQIEDAYEERKAGNALSLSEPELRVFIREQLDKILSLKDPSALTEDADFFNLGMDSLQATQLRSILASQIDTGGHTLGLNIAFDYPSINALAHYLYSLRSGTVDASGSVEHLMQRLIDKYSVFEQHRPMPNGLKGKFLVVTGATGSLGSHVVSKLASQPDVQKIYCLVRARSTIEAYGRLIESFQERRVYTSISDTSRRKLIAVPSDLSKPSLGLDETTYNTITSEITDLIHCAWSVNFNLNLASFEKDSIAGIKNLIDLCLKAQRPAPASFNFCSSVSTVTNTAGEDVLEALPEKLSYAQDMGYAQSKLVAENICIKAAEQTGIRGRVLRIGQVIGDTQHGIWNTTEAIPLILQSATTISALPRIDESPFWLPVDVVADTIIDITFSTIDSGVSNIINPRSFHWTRDLLPYLHNSGLEFEELEQREWIKRLRASNPDPAQNPPIKLVEFFASKYDTDEPRRTLNWHTERARKYSGSLEKARTLDQEAVDKMLAYFTTCWSKA